MSNTVKVITTLILLNLYNVSSNSYIPTYIEGTPITGSITGNAPPDIRGKPLFRIEHKVWLPFNSSHFHFYLTTFFGEIWVPHYTSSRIPNPQFQPTRTSFIFCLFVASFVKSDLLPNILLTSSNNQISEFWIPNIYNKILFILFFAWSKVGPTVSSTIYNPL